MDMQGNRPLPVTQAQAWAALNNPDILKACIPGCDKFELTETNVYAVGVSLKIGPVAAKFTGKVSLMDIVPPTSYALQFEAQGGVAGFGKGTANVALASHDAGCELSYTVHSQVGGKIAQLGQRLIDGVAKNLSEDFFQRFENELIKLHPPAEGAAASNHLDGAADKTESGLPSWFWIAALGVVAVAAVLLTRG
jgi:carbon monoxide dehydrogenase subunit G